MSEQINVMDIEAEASGVGNRTVRRRPFSGMRQHLATHALLRHNVLLFVANMATSGVAYLYHPVVGHLLGPSGYGSIVSLGAVSLILGIPTQIVANVANKCTADLVAQGRMDQVNYLLRRTTRYGLLVGALLAVVFAGLSPVLTDFLKLPSPQFALITGIGFVFAFTAPLNTGVIQGRQQFEWFALFNFLGTFMRVAITGVVLLLGGGISGVLWISLLSGTAMYAITYIPIRDVLRTSPARIPSLKPLLVYSLSSTAVIASGLLLINTDTILAKHFLSPSQAGYYAAVATLGRTVLFVGGSFVWVMFPKVAALHKQGRPHGVILAWTMAGVFALSASVVLVFWLFPNQVITLIFHAPTAVSQQLVWYGVAMLLLALSNVLMYYFLSVERMAFLPLLLICCILQGALIVIWHSSIAQIVTTLVAVTAVLLFGLAVLYTVQEWQARSGKNLVDAEV